MEHKFIPHISTQRNTTTAVTLSVLPLSIAA